MTWQQQTDDVMRICTETFTTLVTYTPVVGAPFSVKGIFDAAYQEVQILDGAAVQTTQPKLGIRLSDFAVKPKEGDRCTINSVVYRVTEYRPDGEAGASLMLHKV